MIDWGTLWWLNGRAQPTVSVLDFCWVGDRDLLLEPPLSLRRGRKCNGDGDFSGC